MANPQASDEAVLRACEIGALTAFVNAHPRGFDLMVGERGESLSGGQRKCVALARALIHDPQILLMDEPTGSMDHSTEAHVRQHLSTYTTGKTFLVSTHRTSLLDMVERVIVMDAGQFVADGPKAAVVEALKQRRITKAQ
jgi:ATP-binding cassette subfamily C protein LapB